MRRAQRLIAVALVIALSGALAGCSGGGFSSFDPTDWLDFLDTKKKLEGERKPVFPDGVPGLEQGVPKQLYKGASQQQIDADNARARAAAAAAATPVAEPKSKRAKSKDGKPPATAGTAAVEDGSTAEAPPAPKPKKIAHRRTTAPPPDQPAGAPAQPAAAGQPSQAAPPSQQSAAPFPAPMPSGTFAR